MRLEAASFVNPKGPGGNAGAFVLPGRVAKIQRALPLPEPLPFSPRGMSEKAMDT